MDPTAENETSVPSHPPGGGAATSLTPVTRTSMSMPEDCGTSACARRMPARLVRQAFGEGYRVDQGFVDDRHHCDSQGFARSEALTGPLTRERARLFPGLGELVAARMLL